MKKPRIAVVGSSNTDMIVKVDRIPRPGETVLGGEFCTAPGGKGANQAVAAARAGGAVCFISKVGNDALGAAAVRGFEKDGISTKHVSRDAKAPSGVALIFVGRDGENSIAVAGGANSLLSPRDVRKARLAISEADVLVVQLETPMATVVASAGIAHAAGVTIILNPAPARSLPPALLGVVSVLTPNETEAQELTGISVRGQKGLQQAADRLLEMGVQSVVLTCGARGAYIATASHRLMLPAFKVKAVDTTAAGDVFNGTLAVALGEGRNLPDAVRFASAAAAISVTRMGAQPSAPQRREIERLLSESHSGK